MTKLKIKAKHIGPIMELEEELSDKSQNLIFARNGTGKSFLARALRELDPDIIHDEESSVPDSIVSEESSHGLGGFTLSNDKGYGRLKLDTGKSEVVRDTDHFLFHVFSTDYIETELRSKKYNLDGEIDRTIIIGQDNHILDAKIEELDGKNGKKPQRDIMSQKMEENFNSSKEVVRKNFAMRANLGAFQSLSTDKYFRSDFEADPNTNLAEKLQEYEKLKSIPSDPNTPDEITTELLFVDLDELKIELQLIVSPSSISEEVRSKIISDPTFFQKGLELNDGSNCPFCTQTLDDIGLATLKLYEKYFEDSEAKAQKKLDVHYAETERKIAQVSNSIKSVLTTNQRFEELKEYFPSFKANKLHALEPSLEELVQKYQTVLELITTKKANLATSIELPQSIIEKLYELKRLCSENETSNNEQCKTLIHLITSTGSSRRTIQAHACAAFEDEFFTIEKHNIEQIKQTSLEVTNLENEIRELQLKSGDKVSARDKVAKTFEMLLKKVFGAKYSFDKERFVIQRNSQDMSRGGDRTLSDGEKSVLAFCYFLAQIHLKVEKVEDYHRIFLVIDDPVSSLSFDYIYSIAQLLKLIRIKDNDLSFDVDGGICPHILILTHNDYFFNVLSTNNVIKSNALFELKRSDTCHVIKPLKGFVSPHIAHLRDVYEVSNKYSDPCFTTPNSIRSVLEGIWKFVRPDLLQLHYFIKALDEEHDLQIKSILINSLSHGGHFNERSHTHDDILLATQEVVFVVKKFAPGQLERLDMPT